MKEYEFVNVNGRTTTVINSHNYKGYRIVKVSIRGIEEYHILNNGNNSFWRLKDAKVSIDKLVEV